MPAKLKKKDYFFLTALIIVHALFYIMALHFKKIYSGDAPEYIQEALNIKDHFFFYCGNMGLPIREEYMTLRPPLYPLFIMFVYLFAINNWIVLLLQSVLSVTNIFFIRDTLFRLGYNKKYDWLLLLLVIAYPSQFLFSNCIASDILFQSFVVIYFRHFVLMVYDKNWKHALWMSIALVLGAMVRPIFYPFVAVHFVGLFIMAYLQKVNLSKAAGIGLLPILVILVYNTWNYERTGKFHFSSIEAINANYNIWEYNNSKLGAIKGTEMYNELKVKIAAKPSYKERYNTSVKIARQFIKQHFVSYSLFHLKHVGRIFIEPGKAEIDFYFGWLSLTYLSSAESVNKGFYATMRERGWSSIGNYIVTHPSMPMVIIVFMFNCIRLAGFIMFICSKRFLLLIRLFVLLLMAYFTITVGPVSNTRYFLPVSLIMIACSVLGFQAFYEKRKRIA